MLEDIPLGTPVNYSSGDKVATNHSGWWVGLGIGYKGMPENKKYIACHILNAATDAATATNNKCWWSMFDANYGEKYVVRTDGAAITGVVAKVTKDTTAKTLDASWMVSWTVNEVTAAADYKMWMDYAGAKVDSSFSQGKVLGGATLKYQTHGIEGQVFDGSHRWSGAVQNVLTAGAALLAVA